MNTKHISLLLCGFVLALGLLFVAGFRMTSGTEDKPILLLNAAMVEVQNREGEKAKALMSSAYEACLDDGGNVSPRWKSTAATIKFRQANLLVGMQDIEGAIEAYCESLRLEPDNMDAKYNLELLLLRTGGGGSGKPIIVPGSGQSREQGI